MNVEVLVGPPGCGKSYEMRQEAIRNPGLYLFAYPTTDLLLEQADAFEAESDLPVRQAHSKASGGGSVQSRLERYQAEFAERGTTHGILLITHEGLMGADLSEFTGWHIRIDESPNTLQSGQVNAPASAAILKDYIAIEPVGSGGWGELRLLGGKAGWRDLEADALFRPLAEMLKQASRQHGVFVDTVDWKDSFGWCSIWPHSNLRRFRSAKVAGASYPISLGAVVARRWEGINFVEREKPVARTGEPTIRVHYFTRSHEGTTTFWSRRRGRGFIKNLCDFLSAKEPSLGFWSANDVLIQQLDHRLNGKPVSAKVAGLNEFDRETSCAIIYSSKALPQDRPAKDLFGITDDEILRAREEEDVLQFVTRGAIRRPEFDGFYDIYVYSERQAKLLSEKLAGFGTVELVPEHGAGIMDADPEPMKNIRAALTAQKAAEKAEQRRMADAQRKKRERAAKAETEGRPAGRGGRPAGSKDKTPRKPRRASARDPEPKT